MIPRIKVLYIRNFKSIGQSEVNLGPFCAFVGPNGVGKSNFLDALAFVQESLADSIELAFKNRGGIGAVRRKSGGHPTHMGIRLNLELEGAWADYAFEIAAKPTERFRVARERCIIRRFMGEEHAFEIQDGVFTTEIPGIRPKVSSDRLALFAASATEEFRPVYDFLTAMRFYSVVPDRLRELQEADPGDTLKRDGSNAAAVLKKLMDQNHNRDSYQRLCRLLSKVATGVQGVEHRAVGQHETLQFKQDVGQKHPWTFDALNMSDGTLRVLGILIAIYQINRPTVIAIEEPEATVHPAVTDLLTEVLLEASQHGQVLLTTHSPDVLDDKKLGDSQIRVVSMQRGNTIIAPMAPSSRQAVQEHLYTPGELLRADELNPDLATMNPDQTQSQLFDPPDFERGEPS